MSRYGVGRLVFLDGTLDAVYYTQILSNNIRESAEIFGMTSYKFQQDNDPKHTSNIAKEFFDYWEMNVIKWPSQSPDLNPIEHLWGYMKQKLRNVVFDDEPDLINKISIMWSEIGTEYCEKLVDSMKDRIREVILAKGGHTSY